MFMPSDSFSCLGRAAARGSDSFLYFSIKSLYLCKGMLAYTKLRFSSPAEGNAHCEACIWTEDIDRGGRFQICSQESDCAVTDRACGRCRVE